MSFVLVYQHNKQRRCCMVLCRIDIVLFIGSIVGPARFGPCSGVLIRSVARIVINLMSLPLYLTLQNDLIRSWHNKSKRVYLEVISNEKSVDNCSDKDHQCIAKEKL